MRLKSILLVFALAGVAGAQVWEKPIAPGLVYRMEIDTSIPRVIYGLRFTPGSPTRVVAELAGKTVYQETAAKGCATVSQIVASEGAVAGLNGDFFPYTGDPTGAMVRSGELVSVPTYPRACFGWSNTKGSGSFGMLSFKGSLSVNGSDYDIDNVDGACPQNGLALNTGTAAFSLCKAPNVHVFVKIDQSDFSPNGTTTGVVKGMTADVGSLAVPDGCFVLVAQGKKMTELTPLRAGDKVTVRFHCEGFDWKKVDQLISGGPFLVQNGQITPDSEAEKFRDDFVKQRHPRSAVGRTADGDFWFVAVDGRQPESAGATIQEMGEIMFKLGCRDAINLDGGGSTDMNILGVNVNRPSDGFERPVATALLFFAPPIEKTAGAVVIDSPSTLAVGQTATLRATLGGKEVDSANVIWNSQGGAWIDQGGLLTPLKAGAATVTAWIQGQIVQKKITITAADPRTKPLGSRSGQRGGRKGKGG